MLAVSNFLKPLQLGADVGFVLFGQRLTGTANTIAGPIFGLYLLVYAAGIWRMKRYALPMAYAYALYVVVNLIMWTYRMPEGAETSAAFGIAYMTVAIGVSSGAAVLLHRSREQLS